MIGLVRAVPQMVILLFGGLLADAINRRKLMMITQGSLFFVSGALALLTLTGQMAPLKLYVITVFLAFFSSLEAPSRHAIVTNLVPERKTIAPCDGVLEHSAPDRDDRRGRRYCRGSSWPLPEPSILLCYRCALLADYALRRWQLIHVRVAGARRLAHDSFRLGSLERRVFVSFGVARHNIPVLDDGLGRDFARHHPIAISDLCARYSRRRPRRFQEFSMPPAPPDLCSARLVSVHGDRCAKPEDGYCSA